MNESAETTRETPVERAAEKEEPRRPSGAGAAVVGALVFLLGVCLVLWVFYLAYQMYFAPADQLINAGQEELDLRTLAESTIYALFRILLLFVMTVAGSVLAGKGMQLYYSARVKKD